MAGEAERCAAPALRRALVLTMARTALRLGFSGAAAIAVGRLVMDGAAGVWLFAALALLAAAQAAGWLADRAIAQGEAEVADELRRLAMRGVEAASARAVQAKPVGEVVVALQRYPQSVAALALGHRVATLMMAVGPLCAAAALILASWQAALLLIVLTPLMIVFFALIGDTIRKRAKAQEQALGHLAGQFADRIRALPTIIANHATDTETAKLEQRQQTYADNTMRVLRIAFLNAGIIDFFSSLSIAMLAVFLGLGHL